MFEDLITGEMRRQENADSELCNDLSVTSQRWRNTKRFFTGERGAWSSRLVCLWPTFSVACCMPLLFQVFIF